MTNDEIKALEKRLEEFKVKWMHEIQAEREAFKLEPKDEIVRNNKVLEVIQQVITNINQKQMFCGDNAKQEYYRSQLDGIHIVLNALNNIK